MRGKNPVRPPSKGDGFTLDVQEIFDTFQGEGPFAGVPAVFVRLGGCNLACDFCDAEFEDFSPLSVDAIVEQITQFSFTPQSIRIRNLVVITGGEPLRQPLAPLCNALLDKGYDVQLETNGTLHQPLDKRISIVCSPKNTGVGYKAIRKDLLPHVSALKFILSATHPLYQNIAELGQTAHNIPVYIQPMDEYDATLNQNNLDYVKRLALEKNYIVSLQLQKIAGVK